MAEHIPRRNIVDVNHMQQMPPGSAQRHAIHQYYNEGAPSSMQHQLGNGSQSQKMLTINKLPEIAHHNGFEPTVNQMHGLKNLSIDRSLAANLSSYSKQPTPRNQ